jgi:hypothetical protein
VFSLPAWVPEIPPRRSDDRNWFALKSKLLLSRSPAFCDFVTLAIWPANGTFDGISQSNRCEQDLHYTQKLLSTIRVIISHVRAVTQQVARADTLITAMSTPLAPFDHPLNTTSDAWRAASPLSAIEFCHPRTIANWYLRVQNA